MRGALTVPDAPPRPSRAAGGDATLVLLGLAGVKLAALLAGRYGWHRDELYYAAAGTTWRSATRTSPPLTPLLARLATTLSAAPWPASGCCRPLPGRRWWLLAGLLARELGGGRSAQVLAGLAALCSPLLLGSNGLMQTVSFDQPAWTVTLYFMVRLLASGQPRWWRRSGSAWRPSSP
jgi:hypothetical protein